MGKLPKLKLPTFFAKYVWKWLVVKDKHIKIKPRIYVLFVFDWDNECRFIKNNNIV